MSAEGRAPVPGLAMLTRETEARFDAIHERHRQRMECRPGCSACCRARLSVTRLEEHVIRAGLEGMEPAARRAIRERVTEPGREYCPALEQDGRCGIYAHRPLICRGFGVPQRRHGQVPMIQPPVIDVCDLNFTDVRLERLPDEDILEQSEIEERVAELNRTFCEARGLDPAERIPLAQILG